MGTFTVEIEIGPPSRTAFRKMQALVDTGATHTLLPGSLLHELNVEPIDRIPFELADERIVEYDIGEVRLRLDGKERTALVVFGEDDAAPLLGATTLELFNLTVDPIRQRLMPVSGLLK